MGHTDDSHGPDWVGSVLDGRYQIESVIGMGGMGITYLASDRRQFGRSVAIKVPHEEVLATRTFKERFSQEIKQLIAREHPHIVKLYDSGDLDGIPYAVLQYLPGGSLRTRMQPPGSMVRAAEVMQWLPAIAEALDFIHGNVLHRDVKPENILFDAEGHAYLVDFGIAKVLSDPMLVTKTGAILGSPPYMAPEVATGKRLAPTYDQYALAVVVFEALSGQWPHEGGDDPIAFLLQKASQPPRSLRRLNPRVPKQAAEAVMKALSTDPRHRYESCRQFATAFAEGTGTRNQWWPAAGASAAALVAVIAWSYSPWTRPQEGAPLPTSGKPVVDAIVAPVSAADVGGQNAVDSRWKDYQARMEQMHAAILEEDRTTRTPARKAARWREFLSEFNADNPATLDDDGLRESARANLQRWERPSEASLPIAPRPVVTVTDRPGAISPAGLTRPEAPPEPVPVAEPKAERDTRPPPEVEQRQVNAEAIRDSLLRASQSLERGDYEIAVKSYEAALAFDPSSVPARQGLERARRAQDAEARVLRRLQEPD